MLAHCDNTTFTCVANRGERVSRWSAQLGHLHPFKSMALRFLLTCDDALSTDKLKKADLEVALDEYLSENQSRFGTHPKAAPYYQSRARAIGSPVKKELPPAAEPKVNKRRAAKVAEKTIASTNVEWVTFLSLPEARPGASQRLMTRNVNKAILLTAFIFASSQ